MSGAPKTVLDESKLPADVVAASQPPQLRVVGEADSGDPLDQFDAALSRGDLSAAREVLLLCREKLHGEQADLERERDEFAQAVGDLQNLLDDRCKAHEQQLEQQKQQLAEWHEQEKQNRVTESESAKAEFQAACDAWELERAEQAQLLVDQRTKLDDAEETLRVAKLEMSEEKAAITAERERLAEEHESLSCEVEELRQQSASKLEEDQKERLRVIEEVASQRESEWAERQKQLEHEMQKQRDMHESQLRLDRESFLRACAEREAELDALKCDIDQQREDIVTERCRAAEQFAETRRQLEQDRTLLQNGLRQMESQLRWVASSISVGGSGVAKPSVRGADSISHNSQAQVIEQIVEESTQDAVDREAGWIGVVAPRDEEFPQIKDEENTCIVDVPDSSEESPETAIEQPVSPEETVESDETIPQAQSQEERRQRIEDYRSQLNNLQASLSELQSTSASPSESDVDGIEKES